MNRIGLSLLVASLSACGQAPPSPATIGRTIVILNPNGEHTIRRDVLTLEQHQQERIDYELLRAAPVDGVGERAQAINAGHRDYSCAGSSLWMFDNAGNQPGSSPADANEICFYKNGFSGCADLTQYFRYCNIFGCNWGITGLDVATTGGVFSYVQSYWGGSDDVYIRRDGGFVQWYIPAYQRNDGPFDAGFLVDPVYNPDLAFGRYVCF
jgi:hypothetical protein